MTLIKLLPKLKQVKLAHINARSIGNKIQPFQEYITKRKVDLCAVRETRVKGDDTCLPKEIPAPGYKILTTPRASNRPGGGVPLVYKNSFKVNAIAYNLPQSTTMEYSSYKIKTSYKEESLNLYVIYRLPSSSVIVFCIELLEITKQEINETCNTLYISNSNIHMDNPHHPDTIIFHDFLKSFNLTNLITEATHKSQHTLNLIITEKSPNIAIKHELGHMLSDHSFIHCNLNMAKPMRKGALITHCDLKKIDQLSLKEDLHVVCNHVVAPDLHEVVTEYVPTELEF